jgi:hypothetical protein
MHGGDGTGANGGGVNAPQGEADRVPLFHHAFPQILES